MSIPNRRRIPAPNFFSAKLTMLAACMVWLPSSAEAQTADETEDGARQPQRRQPAVRAPGTPPADVEDSVAAAPGRRNAGLPPNLNRGPRIGRHSIIRWSERHARPISDRERGLFSPIKHIRLDRDDHVWLTLSGEERNRTLVEDIQSLGTATRPTQIVSQFRHRYGVDAHLGDHLRLFGELTYGNVLSDNSAAGVNAQVRQDNGPEPSELLAEIGTDTAAGHAGLIVGRQRIHLGSGAIFALGNAQNFARSFFGARAYYVTPKTRFEAFTLRPTAFRFGAFNDGIDRSVAARGLYLSTALPRTPSASLNLDGFLIDYRDEASAILRQPSVEQRLTYGARIYGFLGPVQIDSTFAAQSGRIADRQVRAWGMHSVARYRIPNAPLGGTVIVRNEIRSGGSRAAHTIRTYNPLYPGQLHPTFGQLLGGTNYYSIGGFYSIAPARPLEVIAGIRGFWRYSVADGYALPYPTSVTNTRTTGRPVGTLPSLGVRWLATPHLQVNAVYNRLFSSRSHRALGQRDLDSLIVQTSFIF